MMQRRAMQSGAALLAAMLTVALVATLASAAMWLQWRQVEIETAERGRAQTHWLLTGAFDWTRLILAEDGRSAQNIDHLGEPWAIAVQESKLSTFLSQDRQWREGDPEVYLSGQISDAQARLNLNSLLDDGKPSLWASAAWLRLFEQLDLPQSELNTLLQRWPLAVAAAQGSQGKDRLPTNGNTPLLPRTIEQLVWLGLSPATVERLRPYATVLPTATPVNLNTASAIVLQAVIPGLDTSTARELVTRRSRRPWNTLQEATDALGPLGGQQLDPRWHGVSSRYFEVHGRIRIDEVVQEELALVQREGTQVRMIWRQSLPSGKRPPALLQ